MIPSSESFHGQQEDERILLVIRPHWFRKLRHTFYLLLFFCGLAVWLQRMDLLAFPFVEEQHARVAIYLALGFLAALWYFFRCADEAITYLTDRRILRFEAYPFLSRNRRTLFWHEAAKSKAFATNWIFGLFRVGALVVINKHKEENVSVRDVYYYDDVGQYVDKLIYLARADPSRVATVKPFVMKPKWQRDTGEFAAVSPTQQEPKSAQKLLDAPSRKRVINE